MQTQARMRGRDLLDRAPDPPGHGGAGPLGWIAELAPAKAVLTNMHVDLDYATVLAETPPNVEPAYDGMTIRLGD